MELQVSNVWNRDNIIKLYSKNSFNSCFTKCIMVKIQW